MKKTLFILLLAIAGCAQIQPAPTFSTAPPTCSPTRDANGKIARSRAAVTAFKYMHPCPSTGLSYGACPGYVVDHVEPLCNCGADAPANMQWQTLGNSKVKDAWERKICSGRGDE